MRHKRFVYRCPLCQETGLQPDSWAVYKVRVCDACKGKGRVLMTVMQRIELDQPSPDGRRSAGGGE
jgi:DnaJ-class molecular chaperone